MFKIILTLLLAGCTQVPAPAPSTTPPTAPEVIEPAPQAVTLVTRWPNKEWDKLALKALESHGSALLSTLPTDYKDYCPKFAGFSLEEKKAFYVFLISAMAFHESTYNPKATYEEACKDANGKRIPEHLAPKGCGIKDAKGKYVTSAGLMQLSVESGNLPAYKCGLKETSDLFDVETNLNCSVKIMNYWVPRDKIIGKDRLGIARYWSVLRSSPPRNLKKQLEIKSRTKEFCNGL